MGFLGDLGVYVAALLPTIGMLYLFWVVMKHIVEGDRRERAAQREWELRDTRAGSDPDSVPESDTPGT